MNRLRLLLLAFACFACFAGDLLAGQVPGTITYYHGYYRGRPGVYVAIYYKVTEGRTYHVEVTNDAVVYKRVYTFTATSSLVNFSWTVNPYTGPWPRLIEE